jgi:hypothetical protein
MAHGLGHGGPGQGALFCITIFFDNKFTHLYFAITSKIVIIYSYQNVRKEPTWGRHRPPATLSNQKQQCKIHSETLHRKYCCFARLIKSRWWLETLGSQQRIHPRYLPIETVIKLQTIKM